MADAEGNGIELYVDRPREQWPYSHGELQMGTEPLDLDNLLSELTTHEGNEEPNSRELRIGHIHLQVSSVQNAEEFYHRTLGFDVVQRNFPGALFMSAGGYHHHIGANIWNSRGASPAREGSTGLMEFGIQLGNANASQELSSQLQSTEYWVDGSGESFVIRDLDQLRIHIS